MSEPTRYYFDEYGGCYELSHGDYILHSDYEKEVSRLKAEVERLRKAGDAMVEAFDLKYPVTGKVIKGWNEAKEGKQS